MDASSWVYDRPPVESEDEIYECVSPLLSPSQDEEDPSPSEAADIAGEVLVEGVPAYLKPEDAFRTRMRLVQFRNYLIRCQLLYITVTSLERKPWTSYSDAQLDQYYRNIRYLSIKARNIAEAIGSDDLRARSEYWAGRGCGGLQDWQAATTHFTAAMKFDVPHYKDDNGRIRERGLLQDEKDDVEFLLRSVKHRDHEWERKKEDARKAYYGIGVTHEYPEQIQWDKMKGQRWTPDQDRMIEIAKQQFAGRRRSRDVSDYTKEEVETIQQRMALDDETGMTRRTLNEKEWRYIIRGDERRYRDRTSPHHSQQSESSAETATNSPTASTASSEDLVVEELREISLDADKEQLPEHYLDASSALQSFESPMMSLNNKGGDKSLSPRLPIMKRRKKDVERIYTPAMGDRTRKPIVRRSTGSGDGRKRDEEEGEGEMVDVRLDHVSYSVEEAP
ncbi:pyruvate formate lyase activating enzyme [Pyrenophora seminiperda CCB06]|uniref:Pyruvate formate lyase activating enzyme n=1 Tax=Pyrenophora seminiperda CCB06 TaxID=1302712 RepID=A0A3M7MDK1_9PLEO|nr:pyruvate formate lyase activating enzyme [Pyrenophora seminiperda CCB06]